MIIVKHIQILVLSDDDNPTFRLLTLVSKMEILIIFQIMEQPFGFLLMKLIHHLLPLDHLTQLIMPLIMAIHEHINLNEIVRSNRLLQEHLKIILYFET